MRHTNSCGSIRRLLAGGFSLALVSLVAATPARPWETAASTGNPDYYQPPYPVAFVAAVVRTSPPPVWVSGRYKDHTGADVLSANNPGGGNHLYVLLPDGAVKKLFPLQEHYDDGTVDNMALGVGLDHGTVVEPNASEDGRWIYFSYYHDADNQQTSRPSATKMIKSGADIYRMDLGDLIDDPTTLPKDLTVQRLTSRNYVNPPANNFQDPADWSATSMNDIFAQNTLRNDWGTSFLHAVEMRKGGKLKLVYVSDERRLHNSNDGGFANHNFNLHLADVTAAGQLENKQQFQYYTTTSALSPTPLRDGIAFSYQASTDESRLWHIQKLDSAGRWFPLMGYGANTFLFHLGSFCVDTKTAAQPRDVFVGTRYYNGNNEGFGSLWRQDLSKIGLNTYDNPTGAGTVPRQVGQVKITLNVVEDDVPSPKQGGQYIGKFTSPRCAGPDELYMAWTPTSANSKSPDPEGRIHHYRSKITYRPNLDTFDPLEPVDIALEKGQRTVIADDTDTYSLLWPTPMVPWQVRSGDPIQRSAPSVIDPSSAARPGEPFAQIGTSALHNTDRKPFDCWLYQESPGLAPYNPNCSGQPGSSSQCPGGVCICTGNINAEREQVLLNQDGLTYVQDRTDPCQDLASSEVLGVSLNITSNKADTTYPDYETYASSRANGNEREVVKLLGVYDVRGQGDTSFQALVPAHVPFELHLLSSRYGLKLADVRSWHSLQVRETRTNCGGCHQHEEGKSIPFTPSLAAQTPLDMVRSTRFLSYDEDCNPVLDTAGEPTLHVPEWQDLWQDPEKPATVGFDAYCSTCHDTSRPGHDPTAAQVFGYSSEAEAFERLWQRNYAVPALGALGSPAFWAARGMRTDGRDNTHGKFEKFFGAPLNRWPYKYSSVHDGLGLCTSGDEDKAEWVYRFGHWIDNQMPRNESGAAGATNYHFDWYHPAVDFAIVPAVSDHSDAQRPTCNPRLLRLGFWDDSNRLAEVKLEVLSPQQDLRVLAGVVNGSRLVSTSGLQASQILRATAKDPAGNVQRYEKRVSELIADCRRLLPDEPNPIALTIE